MFVEVRVKAGVVYCMACQSVMSPVEYESLTGKGTIWLFWRCDRDPWHFTVPGPLPRSLRQ